MKAEGIHEGCIEQMQRLYSERLYNGSNIPVDDKGRIRIDDLEMRADVQQQIDKLWAIATTESLPEIGDLEGYRSEFHHLFGFGYEGVNYNEDTNEIVLIPSIKE